MTLLNRKKPKTRVEIYSKQDCHLCDDAKAILKKYQSRFAFELLEIDIAKDARLFSEFKEQIPVIFINGKKLFKYRIDEAKLIKKLEK